MTVKEFLKLREDCDDAVISYYAILDNGEKVELEYYSSVNRWVSEDWCYDEDDEMTAEIMVDTDAVMNAEIVSIRLGNFTDITVRL